MIDFTQMNADDIVRCLFVTTCIIVALCSTVEIILNCILFYYKKQIFLYYKKQTFPKNTTPTLASKIASFMSGGTSSPDVIDESTLRSNISPDLDLVEWERMVALEYAKKNLMNGESINNLSPDVAEEVLYDLDGKRSENLDTYQMYAVSGEELAAIEAMKKLNAAITNASKRIIEDIKTSSDAATRRQ